jgi:hypothetical protein
MSSTYIAYISMHTYIHANMHKTCIKDKLQERAYGWNNQYSPLPQSTKHSLTYLFIY